MWTPAVRKQTSRMLHLAAMHLKNGLNETAAALFILYRFFSTARSLCDFKSSLLLQLEKQGVFLQSVLKLSGGSLSLQ